MDISPLWMTVMVVMVIVLVVATVMLSVKAHKKGVETGGEAFRGKVGTAKTDINPKGRFYVYGEYWDARASGEPLKEGDKGRVVEVRYTDEKYLIVEKIEDD